MGNTSQVGEPFEASLRSLLEESKEYVDPARREEFVRDVGLALLIVDTLIVEPLDIFRDLGALLEGSEEYIVPEKKQDFARQAKLALLTAKIALIEALSKEANVRGQDNVATFADNWRGLRRKAEVLMRRLQVLNPPSQQELEAAIMWMAEQGTREDLDLLRHISKSPAYSSDNIEHLVEIAQQRIAGRLASPRENLRDFFGLGQGEFTQIIGEFVGMHETYGVDSATDALNELELIKESLEALFEPAEINQWLRTPKVMFDGKTPVELISEGEPGRVLEVLGRLEEGIQN